MIKAGKALLLAVSLLLVAATTSNAQSLEKISLVTAEESTDICTSPLKPYVLLHTKNCPLSEFKQIQHLGNVKENKLEEFYVTQSIKAQSFTPTPIRSGATPTPTTIVSEIKISTPSPTFIVSETQVASSGNNSDVILDLVNAHRASIGKTAFQKDEALCSLAQTRSTLINGEMARGALHSGLYNMNLPYWITENAKIGGDENETVRWWLNSSIHRRAIQGDYTNACVGCTGNSCTTLFTSYTPKGKPAIATTAIEE